MGRPEFGNIIILRYEEENAVEVAVRGAADGVFIKNEQHPLMPWVFMLRDEMRASTTRRIRRNRCGCDGRWSRCGRKEAEVVEEVACR